MRRRVEGNTMCLSGSCESLSTFEVDDAGGDIDLCVWRGGSRGWHNNPGHRLIKSPKIHIVDSGLAATLADYSASDCFEQRERMGHLLESFVVHKIMAQEEWTDPELRFWHYRDKDRLEVDLVITRGWKTWGVEVKASSTVNRKDGHGLDRLAAHCGRHFQGGFLLYDGKDILPLGIANTLAVPISKLWEL